MEGKIHVVGGGVNNHGVINETIGELTNELATITLATTVTISVLTKYTTNKGGARATTGGRCGPSTVRRVGTGGSPGIVRSGCEAYCRIFMCDFFSDSNSNVKSLGKLARGLSCVRKLNYGRV